ncbi:MAG: transposase [Alphaproteobacteria bacterium]|nr:transposase [Alphaproteobacteria bacterium]MCB9695663.1 transposase [Alphaproteobacteria bacterium]
MLTLEDLPNDEVGAARLLIDLRWPDGWRCVRCDHDKYSHLSTRPRVTVCTRCLKQQSVTAGTPLHGCHVPLSKVLRAAFLLARKESISARRLSTAIKVCHETAWSLGHRLRSGLVFCDLQLDALVSMAELRLARRPPVGQPWIRSHFLKVTVLWDESMRMVTLPGHVDPHAARRFVDRHSTAEKAAIRPWVPLWLASRFSRIFHGVHQGVSDRWMPFYAAATAAWENAHRSKQDPAAVMLRATLARTTHPFASVRPRLAPQRPDLRDWLVADQR